jgi:hypothetical protein
MPDDARPTVHPDDPPAPHGARALTLADVRPGDTVQVRTVPAPVRDVLDGFGLREGAHVRCESSERYVVVRTTDGCVPFERGLLAAVEVAPLDASPPAA